MELSNYTIWLGSLILVAFRVAGIFLVAPVFANTVLPVKLRVFMSLVISLAIVARFAQPTALPANMFDLTIAAVCELAIGAIIGYAARLIFVGVQLAASHISSQMGLALAEIFDPAMQSPAGPVGRLFHILAVVIFLLIGGHRELLSAFMGTFDSVPLRSLVVGEGFLNVATGLLGASFVLALKIAAPVLIALLLATVALGLLQRTLPQCNILSTSIPIRVTLGLLALAVSLAVLGDLMKAAVNITVDAIPEFFSQLS